MSQDTARTDSPARGLFLGRIDDSFYPYPHQDPEERETTEMAVQAFREWAADNLDPEAIDRDQEIPESVRSGLAELGILGTIIPEEYGGYGFGMTSYCRMVEEVTRLDGSLAVFIGAHLSIGTKPLLNYGNEEQKRKYLPGIAEGNPLCSFALTEPEAGSDAGSLKTKATWDPEGNCFRLNGNKIWITNGGYAGLFTVFARAEGVPEALGGRDGITAFLVERGAPGFTNGPSEHKLGIRGTSTVELAFDGTPVPVENVLGTPGEGLKIALHTLETGRLSLGAGGAGASKELVRMAIEHARERKQFRRPIADFGMIREKLGRMASWAYAVDAAVYLTSGLHDRAGLNLSVETGYCKVFGSETLWQVVNDAIQVVGGIGYMAEYPYQRYLRDARINLIFEGANEVMRLAETLVALREPGTLVTRAVKAEKEGLGRAAIEEILGYERRVDRAGVPSWVAEPLRGDGEKLAAAIGAFADRVEEIVRKHRRAILREQYTIRRLADGAIQLFGATASLSRASTRVAEVGPERAAREILLAKRFIDEACRRVRYELDSIEQPQDRYDDEITELLKEEGRYPVGW